MKRMAAGVLALGLLAGTAGLASANEPKTDYHNEVNLALGAGANFSKEGAAFVLRPQVEVDFHYGIFRVGADVYPSEGMGNTAVQPWVSAGVKFYNSDNFSAGAFVGAKGLALGVGKDYSGSYVCQKPQVMLGVHGTLDSIFTGEVSTSVSASGVESVTLSIGMK